MKYGMHPKYRIVFHDPEYHHIPYDPPGYEDKYRIIQRGKTYIFVIQKGSPHHTYWRELSEHRNLTGAKVALVAQLKKGKA